MYAIGQRIASYADKQPEYYLRVLMPSLLGKASLPHFILMVRLKIKRCHIIEQDTDMVIQYSPC